LAAPIVRVAPWNTLDLAAIAVTGAVTLLLLDRTWRRWNRKATASTIVQPMGRTPTTRMVSLLGGLSFVALVVVVTVGMGVDPSDEVGALGFVITCGTALTLLAGVVTVILLLSLDRRAYRAARRSLAGPGGRTAGAAPRPRPVQQTTT
jgi:hypothetical protein